MLTLCGAGAQLSWIYAWGAFLLFSFFHRIYPLPEALVFFCLAAILTFFCRQRGWRRFQRIGMHLVGIAFAGLWIAHTFYYHLVPLWNRSWLTDFLSRPRNQQEWVLLIFIAGYTVVFWTAGILFARETDSYTRACSRFDRGIVAFFCLFLVKLTLQTQMGVEFEDSIAFWMVFPFFIFSLMEIGFARNQGREHHKTYVSGYYTGGILASFAIGTLIIGTAVFMFFLPYLEMASVAGYELMQDAAGPLGPLVEAAVKFIFGHANWDSAAGDSRIQSAAAEPVASSPWMLFVQKVMMWGAGTLMTVAGTVVTCILLWYAVRWLFQKRSGKEQIGAPWLLGFWWRPIVNFLHIIYLRLLQRSKKHSARHFFNALRRWGRFSGVAQKPNETPLEYAGRLSHHFPHSKSDILLIIEMFHREVFGQTLLPPRQIGDIRQAWNNLRSPLRWSLRLKSIFSTRRKTI